MFPLVLREDQFLTTKTHKPINIGFEVPQNNLKSNILKEKAWYFVLLEKIEDPKQITEGKGKVQRKRKDEERSRYP